MLIQHEQPSSGTPADYGPLNYGNKCSAIFPAADDVDLEVLPEVGLTFDPYLPEAKRLAFFIKTAVACNLDIICRYEYGQSRRAACAAAIKKYYDRDGISIFADYQHHPNQLGAGRLRTVNRAESVQ